MDTHAEQVTVPAYQFTKEPTTEPGWSSRRAFVFAAAGSAVGLGNVWKFPYIVGEHGGGAFVLVYLACIVLIGLPILIAEIALGRSGGRSPLHSLRSMARRDGHSSRWHWIAWVGIAGTCLLLSFYSVVAGWSLRYLVSAISFDLSPTATPDAIGAMFSEMLSRADILILCHTVIMAITIGVVAQGVRGGLERATRYLLPGMLILLVGLVGYAATTTGTFGHTIGFLFQPDFSALTWQSILVALGHSFFTLSVGLTVMMAYGSHLSKNVSIAGASTTIAGLDTLVALLAGLAIFPIVFANGLEPASGPGLVFVTLPLAFAEIPGGAYVAFAFFTFLSIAALTSTISILEPTVAYLHDRHHWSRRRATFVAGSGVWLVGVCVALSFNVASDLTLFDKNLFELLDFLTANILLPVGGLSIAIYVGWTISEHTMAMSFSKRPTPAFTIWRFVLRYVTPAGVALILAHNLL